MRLPEELIGTRLGQYEVQALISSGGMADVYQGFDLNLERTVALKVLSEEASTKPDVVERFRHEARLLATLRHPHIVQVYDFGEQEGYLYIVQELLPGPTLAQRLSEAAALGQTLPQEEIQAITAQLASALDAAHAAGIIHRDVKPANILWNAAGRLVLTDFGIAKSSRADAALTRTGQVLGTPAYVSPEQARGEPLTPASDLYALGIVLYEMLAGQPPFRGGTPMEVVLQHLEVPPPPISTVPPAVGAVLRRALAKEPAARFGSASELAQALEVAWSGAVEQPTRAWEAVEARPVEQPTHSWQAEPGPTAEPAPARNRALPFLLVGGLLLLLLAGAAFLAQQRGGEVASPGAGDLSPIAQATTAPTSAPTVAEPSATTAAPVTEPTLEPSPPIAPSETPLPTATAALSADDPLDELQQLLESAVADGRITRNGDKLLNKAEEAQRALAKGDSKEASKALRELQRDLIKGARDGSIDATFAETALEVIDRAVTHHNLSLPPIGGEEDNEEDD